MVIFLYFQCSISLYEYITKHHAQSAALPHPNLLQMGWSLYRVRGCHKGLPSLSWFLDLAFVGHFGPWVVTNAPFLFVT